MSAETFQYDYSGTDNYYTYTFTNLNGLFNTLPSGLNRDSIEKLELAFVVKDEFENDIKIFSDTGFYISFLEAPLFESAQYLKVSNNAGSVFVTMKSGQLLKEGMSVYYQGNIKSYNSSPRG
jgi:hypothetical protein